ncbi:MAG: branched-chain amino acid ABC transporter permease [Bradyrhizobiaceae bacterium]|nr:branched-chain amino acid ABC transporter permease [Bradyrhizobiaceae bacterium]
MRFSYPSLVLLLVIGALPLATTSPYHLTVAGLALIFVILAQGTNLILGTAGQASFAHTAFFGLGAYTTAVLSTRFNFPLWATLPIALVLVYVVGSLLAYPALRVKGFYLALVTLAVSEIFTAVVGEMPGPLGGTEGIAGIPPFTFGEWSADDRLSKFYVVWVGAVLACISIERLHASHFGRVARSLRDSETGASAVGINLVTAKVRVFAVSAVYMGFAGVLYAHFMQYISPTSFGLNITILVVSMVVIGGLGNTLGVLVGALTLSLLPQWTRDYVGLEPLLYGGLLVVIILLLPEGVVPALRDMLRPRRRTEKSS